MKKLLTILALTGIGLTGMAQSKTSATASSTASATIIYVKDTAEYFAKQREVFEQIKADTIINVGYTSRKVLKMKGEPISKVNVLYGDKQKWIYEGVAYYFNEGKVEIVQKIK